VKDNFSNYWRESIRIFVSFQLINYSCKIVLDVNIAASFRKCLKKELEKKF